MKRIVTNRQMKDLDRYTIEEMQMPSLLLMERAALAVVEELTSRDFDLSKVLVVCGSGNNGGDGIAIARLLHLAGYQVLVYLSGNSAKSSEEYRRQVKIVENYGTTFVNNPDPDEYTTIVDSVFGVGLSRYVSEDHRILFGKINEAKAKVLAVDIPSGIDGDSGQIMGAAVKADVTVTFAFAKPGLLLYPGAAHAGEVVIKDIGIYESTKRDKMAPSLWSIEAGDRKTLPERPKYSNKGSFGKVFLVAGSPNMSGAAYLSAKACLRAGVGMVKIHTAKANREILQRQLPETMLSTYGETASLSELDQGIAWADVIGIGPGIGTGDIARQNFSYILNNTKKPLIIDADGLNILSECMELLKQYEGLVLVTPHLGEMSRMAGKEIKWIQQNLIRCAAEFTEYYQAVCVLKDARTITALTDQRIFINTSGNNGMATAGSGDVLSGLLMGLLAQSGGSEMMAPLSVYLHGMAGDQARDLYGERGMMAGDLLDQIASVLR